MSVSIFSEGAAGDSVPTSGTEGSLHPAAPRRQAPASNPLRGRRTCEDGQQLLSLFRNKTQLRSLQVGGTGARGPQRTCRTTSLSELGSCGPADVRLGQGVLPSDSGKEGAQTKCQEINVVETCNHCLVEPAPSAIKLIPRNEVDNKRKTLPVQVSQV